MLAGVGKFLTNFKKYYNEINSATLTGAIDIMVVEQPDGTYQSSPFHVRFGKLGVIRSREKVVYIEINGESVEDLRMKLGPSGEAFFVQPIEEDRWEGLEYLATSPIPEMMLVGDNSDKLVQATFALTGKNSLGARNRQGSDSTSSSSSELAEKHPMRTTAVFQPISDADEDLIESGGMFEFEPPGSDEDHRIPGSELPSSLTKSVSLPMIEENIRRRTESWAFDPYHTPSQFHPFSDTDISPVISPAGSRPVTPKSDTEFEITGRKNTLAEESNAIEQWKWGQLPERSQETERLEKQDKASKAEEESGYLQSFMRSSKKMRHQPQQEGLYLDDLTQADLDPNVAALYFPKQRTNEESSTQDSIDNANTAFKVVRPALVEDDVESGKGTSLPSPAESPPPIHTNREQAHSPTSEAGTMKEHDCRIYGGVAMSMCGGLLTNQQDVSVELFEQCLVTFEAFIENPALLRDKNLVIRVNEKYYNWQCAAPMLMSMFCFHQTLPQSTQELLTKLHMPVQSTASTQRTSSSWWRLFGRSQKLDEAEDTSTNSSPNGSPKKAESKPEPKIEPNTQTDSTIIDIPELGEKARQRTVSGASEQSDTSHYRKTLRLTSEQLEKMNLHDGMNEIEFSVTTAYQGTTRCMAHIFLCKHTDKIIISDIDGTITRSDVLGQILPMVGKDWSQSGVADLYSKIAANGYKFAYLSARAIGQAQITRDYLQNVKQGDVSLPPGPLFLSPSSLINAFHKEVIEKKPEQFKISCMKDIQTLFSTHTALYAGFGNKINDIVAYRAVDIPKARMFLINSSGLLKSDYSETFQSSYKSLSDVVDHYFPSLEEKSGNLHHGAANYSNFTFWREPMVAVNLDEIAE